MVIVRTLASLENLEFLRAVSFLGAPILTEQFISFTVNIFKFDSLIEVCSAHQKLMPSNLKSVMFST